MTLKRAAIIRRVPLIRSGRLQRTPMRHTPTKKRRAESVQVLQAKAIIWLRCKGRCEMCGVALRPGEFWPYSHRRQVGMGGRGDNRVCNGLASCPGPDGCNQRISDDAAYLVLAKELGWVIPRSLDPAVTPVVLGGRTVLLSDDGEYRELPSPLRSSKTT